MIRFILFFFFKDIFYRLQDLNNTWIAKINTEKNVKKPGTYLSQLVYYNDSRYFEEHQFQRWHDQIEWPLNEEQPSKKETPTVLPFKNTTADNFCLKFERAQSKQTRIVSWEFSKS